MNKWSVIYIEEAMRDLDELSLTQRLQVFKAIEKVSQNPLPDYLGGYGKPLGNKSGSKLSGYQKIKLRKEGLRVVYATYIEIAVMKIIVISIREEEKVYKLAQKRIKKIISGLDV